MPNQVNQLAKIMPSKWDKDSMEHYSKLTDAVNTLLGYNGPVPFASDLQLNGNRITNVGTSQSPTDALSSGEAESKYSPEVVGSKLDVGGSNAMKGLTFLYKKLIGTL